MRLINRCFVVLAVVSTGLGTWQIVHPTTEIVMNEGSLSTSGSMEGSDSISGLEKSNNPILGKTDQPILGKDTGRLAADLFYPPSGTSHEDDHQSPSYNQ